MVGTIAHTPQFIFQQLKRTLIYSATHPIYKRHHLQIRMSSSDADLRRMKNLAFVRKWNKENDALYGKKLKVKSYKKNKKKSSKKQVSELQESISIVESKSLNSNEDDILKDIWKDKYFDQPSLSTDSVCNISSEETNANRNTFADDAKTRSVVLDSISRFPLYSVMAEPTQFPQGVLTEGGDLPDFSCLAQERLATVSQVLNSTKSKESDFILKRWISKQIELLGKEGYSEAQKKRIRVASTLHGCVEQFLTGTPVHMLNIEPLVEPYWESIVPVIQEVEEVVGVEVKLEHSKLRYSGMADCIGNFRGEPCLIEWKTSSKPKASVSSLYDYPMQVAAYLGAVHFNAFEDTKNIPKIENALIVVAYEDGSKAHSHFLNRRQMLQFWSQWTQRLQIFWKQKLTDDTEPGKQ